VTAFASFAELPFAEAPENLALPPPPPPPPPVEGPRAARSVAAIQAALLDLLPTGWAWTRAEDTLLARLLAAPAAEMQRFEVAAEALLLQVDPRLSLELLPDFERVLGPDPCGRDLVASAGGLDDRRRSAHARWTAQGFQTPAYYVALCAALGVPATVTEADVAMCGELQAGMELTPDDERFVWVVTIPDIRVIEAEAGGLEAGGLLGELVPSLVECVIRRLAPAHTTPVFSYLEAA
jgi:uncharacterized protein YmfQ (DUF2313 family)